MMKCPLDEFDCILLKQIQRDATWTLEELGTKVGLSGPAIQRRLKRYRESGLITGTTTQVNPYAVGMPITVLSLVTLERDRGPTADSLRKQLFEHPNVQQCYEMAGNFDLVVFFVVPDMESYRGLTAELFEHDDNVRRFATHVALEMIKTTLQVPIVES